MVNAAGVILALTCILNDAAAYVFLVLAMHVYGEILETIGMMTHSFGYFAKAVISAAAVVLINIFAFRAVKKDRPVSGIILSLFGGTVCSFIAVKRVYPDYRSKTAVYVIFNIFIWVLIWLVGTLIMILS